MRAIIVGTLVIGLSAAAAGTASAQDAVVRSGEWSRGTTLSGFAGMAIDSTHNGPAIGGVIGYEVTPRLTVPTPHSRYPPPRTQQIRREG